MSRVLVVDNYDSFTYNLVHLLRELGCQQMEVVRNDKFDLDDVAEFDKVVLSPGPGIPSEAGLMPELVSRFASEKEILGICLGHQCIAEQFGGSLFNMDEVVHGKGTTATVVDPSESIFEGIEETFEIGRYHSWSVVEEGLPDCLKVTARDEDGSIMALAHTEFAVKGLQFHPESVLTEVGKQIMSNWVKG